MYCKHCGNKTSSKATYCPECGKRMKGSSKANDFFKKAIKPFLILLVLAAITAAYIWGYPLYKKETERREAEAVRAERDRIINQMADLNAKTETIDNDRHKVAEILSASQINNETLIRASQIPILLQGHTEIAAVCKEHAAGCVANGKLYVLQVDARETNDWQTITFDHELLHYIYGSFTEEEKKDLNSKLDDTDAKITDSNYKDGLKQYDKNNKEEWHSELFARIGTEIESIPPEVEAYYNQYFLDRMAIVRKNQRIVEFINGLYAKCKSFGNVWTRVPTNSFPIQKNYCEDYINFNSGLGATTKPF